MHPDGVRVGVDPNHQKRDALTGAVANLYSRFELVQALMQGAYCLAIIAAMGRAAFMGWVNARIMIHANF